MWHPRNLRWTVAIWSLGLGLGALSAQEPRERIRESVQVVARTVRFEVTDALGKAATEVPRELLTLREDGVVRPILEVRRRVVTALAAPGELPLPEPPGEPMAGPQAVLVALDDTAMGMTEWERTTRRLADEAEPLLALGPVTIVTLGDAKGPRLVGARELTAVRQAFLDLAKEARPADEFWRGRMRALVELEGERRNRQVLRQITPVEGATEAVPIEEQIRSDPEYWRNVFRRLYAERVQEEGRLLERSLGRIQEAVASLPRPAVLLWVGAGEVEPAEFINQLLPEAREIPELLDLSREFAMADARLPLRAQLTATFEGWSRSGVRVLAWSPFRNYASAVGIAELQMHPATKTGSRVVLSLAPAAVLSDAAVTTGGTMLGETERLGTALERLAGPLELVYQTNRTDPGWRKLELDVSKPGWRARLTPWNFIPPRQSTPAKAVAAPSVVAGAVAGPVASSQPSPASETSATRELAAPAGRGAVESIGRTVRIDVVDARGRPVEELPPDVLELHEDGRAQPVFGLSPTTSGWNPRPALPMAVLIAIDPRGLEVAERAEVEAALAKVPERLEALGPLAMVRLDGAAKPPVALQGSLSSQAAQLREALAPAAAGVPAPEERVAELERSLLARRETAVLIWIGTPSAAEPAALERLLASASRGLRLLAWEVGERAQLGLLGAVAERSDGLRVAGRLDLAEAIAKLYRRWEVTYLSDVATAGWRELDITSRRPEWRVHAPRRILVPPKHEPMPLWLVELPIGATITALPSENLGTEHLRLAMRVGLEPLRQAAKVGEPVRFLLRLRARLSGGEPFTRDTVVGPFPLPSAGDLAYRLELLVPVGTEGFALEVIEAKTGARGVLAPRGFEVETPGKSEASAGHGATAGDVISVNLGSARFIAPSPEPPPQERLVVRFGKNEQPLSRLGGGAGSPLELGVAVDVSESVNPLVSAFALAARAAGEQFVRAGDRCFRVDFAESSRLVGAARDGCAPLFQTTPAVVNERTDLFGGILEALRGFEGKHDRAALLVLTDGCETESSTAPSAVTREARRRAVPLVVLLDDRASCAGTPGASREVSRRELGTLASQSGGVLLHLEREGASAATWGRIQEILDRLWVAVFQPTSPDVRSEQVEVAERGGVVLRPN